METPGAKREFGSSRRVVAKVQMMAFFNADWKLDIYIYINYFIKQRQIWRDGQAIAPLQSSDLSLLRFHQNNCNFDSTIMLWDPLDCCLCFPLAVEQLLFVELIFKRTSVDDAKKNHFDAMLSYQLPRDIFFQTFNQPQTFNFGVSWWWNCCSSLVGPAPWGTGSNPLPWNHHPYWSNMALEALGGGMPGSTVAAWSWYKIYKVL